MFKAFVSHLDSRFPELSSGRFLLACSGGVDSMVLAHLCARAGLEFALAHCNFNLRGREGDLDQELVERTARQLGKEVYVKGFKTKEYVEKNKVSVQMAARELRYRWFDTLAREKELACIATAHHLDDALETFLINLSRGSGLEGLCGIPERNGMLRRPLLPFRRVQLENYARDNGIQWREDQSNTDTKYLRNRVRHEVLPILEEVFPGFSEQAAMAMDHLRGSRELVGRYVEAVRDGICSEKDGVTAFPVEALKRLEPLEPHLYQLFSGYGFTDWDAVRKLVDAGSGREVTSKTHRLLRNREALLLKPVNTGTEGPFSVSPDTPGVRLPLRLQLETVPFLGEPDPAILYVDKETLNNGLILRKWRKGDYFYPLGMQGRKKVSKFFKDIRLSRYQKEDCWLLCSGEDIVWIIGYRADDRFKVTDATREILKITWERN